MNEQPSDQEISNRYKGISALESSLFKSYMNAVNSTFKSKRDELFNRLLMGWNKEREKNGFKKIGAARLASAIKRNPFLKNDDGELELLIKECETKGIYKKAHFILFK